MARFAPLAGTRYDLGQVDLNDVIAPPYDVVGPDDWAMLAARSPYNSILVEAPRAEGHADPYALAAQRWRTWHDEGVVRREDNPAFYLYRMSYRHEDGTVHSTVGVVGALGLDREHRGDVLPHEETIQKDRSDRLSLLRAARTNFSPIWGLSLCAGLGELCRKTASAVSPGAVATDEDGVLHECFVVTTEALLEEVVQLVASAPVLIADGHHRYETALEYADETTLSAGADAILAFVAELSEGELDVQAIHRLLSSTDVDQLREALAASFEMEPTDREDLSLGEEMASTGSLGLALGDRTYLLRPTREAGEPDAALLSDALRGVQADVRYETSLTTAIRSVRGGEAQAAVLLRPVSVEQISMTAHGGSRLPPKSTFFYPKLRTGMVFRELDDTA